MKKYIMNCIVASGLFCASIAGAMDSPSLDDIIARLQKINPNEQIGTIALLGYECPLRKDVRVFRPVTFPYAYDSPNAQPQQMYFSSKTRISSDPAAAQEHNKNVPLITLPKDLLGNVLTGNGNSIIQSMNAMLSLSATCTHFNSRLEELGKMLQCYDQETKNTTLKNLLKHINDCAYLLKRSSLLLLVYARAEHNACYLHYPLLQRATQRNDLDMVNILFQYGAHASLKDSHNEPIFFYAKTPEMAELFEVNGADLNITIDSELVEPNVLFDCLVQDKPKLIEFYLDKKVNPRLLNGNKRSLLHYMGWVEMRSYKVSLPMVKILLNTIGDMINLLDEDNKTALDLLIADFLPKKTVIELFKKYGAKTSEELKPIELAKKEKAPTIIQQDKPA